MPSYAVLLVFLLIFAFVITQVWALAVSRDERHVVSGGADSCIILFHDDSAEKIQAQVDEEKHLVICLFSSIEFL